MIKTLKLAGVFLFLQVLSLSSYGQNTQDIIVTGVVKDGAGMPVLGVNVIEKGVNNGTVTDFDGNYSIEVKKGATLVFSYVGLKTIEKVVEQAGTVSITMQDDVASLDEVVVVGYGKQKREAITGSVATVDVEEVEDLPVGDLSSALVGRVLGVQVSGGQTRPGQAARITIRQPFTLAKDGGTTDPLYVIDGMLQIDPNSGRNDSTLFNNLDASEIESISFLKDASAAIYGSRAAQGVVLVTTKRGKKGPAKFTYTGNFSVADAAYETEMMNASQYARAFNIMNGPNGRGIAYDPTNPTPNRNYFFTPNELNYFENSTFNHLKDNWSAAFSQRHNLNISGGSDDATYFAGLSYYTQEGNLGTLNYDRYSFRAGSNMKLAKGFSADFAVSGYFTDTSNTFSKVGSENVENDYRQLLNRAPFLPMYINDLPVMMLRGSSGDDLFGYHYEEIQRLQNLAETTDSNVSLNINLKYEIPFVDGLTVGASYIRQESNNRGNQLGNKYTLYEFLGPSESPSDLYILYPSGSGPLGENNVRPRGDVEVSNGDRIYIANTRSVRNQMRFQMNYDKTFGLHNVSAFFAAEKSESEYNKEQVIKFGAPEWSNGMLWEATGIIDPSNTYNWKSETGDLGYIGRLNYDYDGKYFAEFLFRSDASQKFAPENYWGSFFSVSAGWIISKEDFFESNVIDFWKFRMSLGKLGKDDTKMWQWLQRYSFQGDGGVVFGGDNPVGGGLEASGPANPDIRWSDEYKSNFGFEFRFLDHRLSTSIETYYTRGRNMLINLNQGVPFTVGGATTSSNYAEVDTWGTEFNVGWNDTVGDDFSYGVNVNMSWGNNKVIQGDFSDPSLWYPWQQNQPGNSDRGTWGFDYVGMFKNQEQIDNYIAETGITQMIGVAAQDLRPGMLYYKDLRGAWDPDTQSYGEKDGIVDEWDQIQLRKPITGISGFDMSLRLKYKRFSLNTVLSAYWSGYREVGGTARDALSTNISSNYENRPAFWGDMYDPELNPSGKLPNMYPRGELGNGVGGTINTVSSRYWEVSDFSLNMRNITMSYALPKSAIEKIGMSTFSLNLVAMNPFILYNPYKDYGLTPYGGYDNYPTLSTYSLGLRVGF